MVVFLLLVIIGLVSGQWWPLGLAVLLWVVLVLVSLSDD